MNISLSSSSSESPARIKYDMRKFIHRIGYLADSFNYYGKAALEIRRRDDGKAISAMLTDPGDYHSHRLRTLHQRVQLLDRSDSGLSLVWNLFYDSVLAKDPTATKRHFVSLKKLFPSDPSLMAFADIPSPPKRYGTDLQIFEDDDPRALPPNGIRRGEVQALNDQYLAFVSLLTFDTAPVLLDPRDPSSLTHIDRGDFIAQVLQDVRILMSRPIGRELIRRILNRHAAQNIKIQIKAFPQGCNITKTDATSFRIQYAIQPAEFLQRIPGNGLQSLSTPPFIRFGHELIHMLHYLDGEDRHFHDPIMDPRNTNPEEWRTIDGKCRCPNHQNPQVDPSHQNWLKDERHLTIHPIHENSLRDEFDLPQRETHFYGSSKHASDREKLEHAFKAGADGDVIDVIQANRLSSPDLDHVVRKLAQRSSSSRLPDDMLPRVVDAAIKDRGLRRGRILGILKSPEPPLSPSTPLSPVLSSAPAPTSFSSSAPAPNHVSSKRQTRSPLPSATLPKRQHLAPPPSNALTSVPDTSLAQLANSSLVSLFPSLNVPSQGPRLSVPGCTCPNGHHRPSLPASLPRSPISSLARLSSSRRSLDLSSTPQLRPPIQATVDPDFLEELHPAPLPSMTSSHSHSHVQHVPGPQLRIPAGPSQVSQQRFNTTSYSQPASSSLLSSPSIVTYFSPHTQPRGPSNPLSLRRQETLGTADLDDIYADLDPDNAPHPVITTSSRSRPPEYTHHQAPYLLRSQPSQPHSAVSVNPLTYPGQSMSFQPDLIASYSPPNPHYQPAPPVQHQVPQHGVQAYPQHLGQPSVNPTLNLGHPIARTSHPLTHSRVPTASQAHPHQPPQQVDSSGMSSIDLAHIYAPLRSLYNGIPPNFPEARKLRARSVRIVGK